jgi:hypothetical protein
MRSFRRLAICFLVMFSFGAPGIAQEAEEHVHASPGSEEGLGHAHMEISCSPAVTAKFDRALALLHNFWYGRALEGFQQVSNIESTATKLPYTRVRFPQCDGGLCRNNLPAR